MAVVLALLSVVPVTWALQHGHEPRIIDELAWHPLGTEQALVLALGSVLPAAVLGGAVGAIVWRRRRTVAPAAAIAVAWFVGIVALPIVAGASDIPLRDGIVCVDACQALLTREEPFGGLPSYAQLPLTWPFLAQFLLIPLGAFLLARRFGHPVLWIATWLSLVTVLNLFSIWSRIEIYASLVLGVLLWATWLWGRDARHPAFSTTPRRWLVALVPLVAAMAVAGSVVAATWIPNVPEAIDMTVLGDAELAGPNPPDASASNPSLEAVRTPDGSGCFDPLIQRAGRLDVCWEAYRDRREHLPGGDRYQFRLVATLHASIPRTWVALDLEVPDEVRTRIANIWPEGVADGPCRLAFVERMNFLTNGSMTNDVAEDVTCGRTTSWKSDRSHRQRVIWTCSACGAAEVSGRQIAIRHLVGTAQGSVPTWRISAAVGGS